jgi:hypothetical protein
MENGKYLCICGFTTKDKSRESFYEIINHIRKNKCNGDNNGNK